MKRQSEASLEVGARAPDGTGAPLNLDASGNLKVTNAGGGAATDVNLTQIDGTAASVNNGTADAGTLRVTVASDSTGQIKLAAGSAVIGHVITDTGSTTVVTGNVTVVQPTGTNLHAVIDSGSTTAVTGNVTVVQGTGTNLHAVLDSGSTTTVTQATGTNLHTVVDSISGTLGVTQSTSPWIVAGGGTAGTAATGVVTVQGIASMTKLLVTPDANSSVNLNQIAGTAASVNSGNKDNGTLRVVLATDQPALSNNLLVTATGNVASDAIDSGNPVKIGMLAKTADITAVSDADRVDVVGTTLGKQITIPYATPALTWSYAPPAGGLVTTGGVTVKAAGTGAQRNYVTRVQAINSHQTIGTEVVIRDGAGGTVMWRGWAQFAGGGCSAVFDPPLRGSAATLTEIAEVTATATAGVLVNVQGFVASE